MCSSSLVSNTEDEDYSLDDSYDEQVAKVHGGVVTTVAEEPYSKPKKRQPPQQCFSQMTMQVVKLFKTNEKHNSDSSLMGMTPDRGITIEFTKDIKFDDAILEEIALSEDASKNSVSLSDEDLSGKFGFKSLAPPLTHL